MKRYPAPWGILLIALSVLQTLLCLAVAFLAFRHGGFWLGLLPLLLLAGCACFTIRGYSITPEAILVHRLFWATRLPRADMQSAQFEPLPRWTGLRIGNGGFFAFTGFRYGWGTGLYRVFLTDHRQVVVLRYPQRTVAISPATPEEFVRQLSKI
jgi:hypothetical protein